MKTTETEIKFTWKERRNGISSLRRAKKLFAGGKRWTTGTYREGLEDGTAKFCSIGAVNEADGAGEQIAVNALNCALHKDGVLDDNFTLDLDSEYYVVDFNDSLDAYLEYRHVSKLFDTAVNILKRGVYKYN